MPLRPGLILATDYDGTLAHHDHRLVPETIAALERFRKAGGTLILVTGRIVDELSTVCPRLDLFDAIVAENGALLVRPAAGTTRRLAEPPPSTFVEALRARGVGPIAVGEVVVATWRPHEETVEQVIRERQLGLSVILNKRAVMVLPTGVDKASGLRAALDELHIAPAEVAAIGDAENDLDFLAFCGLAVAVQNALPAVKARAGLVTRGERGAGVVELIDALLAGSAWPAP
ncbi:MAG: HAD family hydrolase [Isosphaeraceae bacterium]